MGYSVTASGAAVVCDDCYKALGRIIDAAPTHWWLSYADPNLPEGTQFLGVVIAATSIFEMATVEASVRGLNPGGECMGAPFTHALAAKLTPDDVWVLLTKEQARALDDRLEASDGSR